MLSNGSNVILSGDKKVGKSLKDFPEETEWTAIRNVDEHVKFVLANLKCLIDFRITHLAFTFFFSLL